MMTGRNDDAASIREDSYLARLIPQVADRLAEQQAGDFDAEAGQTRFRAWLTEHNERPDNSPGNRWPKEGPAIPAAEVETRYPQAQEGWAGKDDYPNVVVTLPGHPRDQAPEWRYPYQPTPAAPAPAAPAPAAAAAAAVSDEVRIGMWGPPASGKTTFLAALRFAVGTDRANGRWAVYPDNEASAELMVRSTHDLVTEHEFPSRTDPEEDTEVRWHLIGDLAGSQFDRRKLRRRAPMPSRFTLNLADVSGEAFAYPESRNAPLYMTSRALDHLASAQGLLYFFDPLSERQHGMSAEYLNWTIIALSRRMLAEDQLVNGYLPHYVAVCITKFDNPELFQQARRIGLVTPGPDGRPQVLGKDAEALFNMICDGRFWKDHDGEVPTSARFVRDELKKRFHPDRIRYFVTSAIGFRQQPERDSATDLQTEFDPDNYANTYQVEGRPKIRGPITPINVLEPLLSLQQRISGTARTRVLRAVPPDDNLGDVAEILRRHGIA